MKLVESTPLDDFIITPLCNNYDDPFDDDEDDIGGNGSNQMHLGGNDMVEIQPLIH